MAHGKSLENRYNAPAKTYETITADDGPTGFGEQARRYRLMGVAPCTACGQPGPHFVPPSLGDPGFYACVPGDLKRRRDERDAERLEW